MAKIFVGITILSFLIILQTTTSQIAQQQFQLPEVLRRLSLPYHICTRTIDNIWECTFSSNSDKNTSINSIETVTKNPEKPVSNAESETNQSELSTTEVPNSVNLPPTTSPAITTVKEPAASSTTSSSTLIPCSPVTVPANDKGTGSDSFEIETEANTSETSTLPSGTGNGPDLIFEDDFKTFDLETWSHDVTMAGGGNWEFQIYVNNRSNSFVRNGMLHLRPTLTADTYGEKFLSSGLSSLHGGSPADQCTNAWAEGCEKRGTSTNILNPIMSAKIQTAYSFAFKYGRVEIRAKLPSGDWLRPGISLLPFKYNYGRWPASGEIHMVESRGNKDLESSQGELIGVNQVSSSLDFGPFFPLNGKDKAEFKTMSEIGFDDDFHVYELEWTEDFIRFSIDGNETGKIEPSEQGFWEIGQFENRYSNPWMDSENIKMAPFDQKFYLAINLAVGGTNGFFPDDSAGPFIKPWSDLSTTAYKEFWSSRSDWFPSWQNSSFIIDYVRVYSS